MLILLSKTKSLHLSQIFLHFLFNFPLKMKKPHLVVSLFLLTLVSLTPVHSQTSSDAAAMQALKTSLGNPASLGWTDPNPCKWVHIQCSTGNRVTRIQIGGLKLQGTLPKELNSITSLTVLEVMKNQLTGPIPSLSGLNSLQQVLFERCLQVI